MSYKRNYRIFQPYSKISAKKVMSAKIAPTANNITGNRVPSFFQLVLKNQSLTQSELNTKDNQPIAFTLFQIQSALTIVTSTDDAPRISAYPDSRYEYRY